jgi:hypothetical protein
MKSLVLATIVIAAAIGTTQTQAAALWTPGDARPEVLVTGATLLVLSGVVRNLTARRAK